MDKGPAGRHHTLVGERGVHNWLLGGYGNDTIIGGNIGDVIWGDYHPSGFPKHQTATIHAGNGRNVIYANDTVNYVWTGTNPRTVVHAHASGIGGVIHCQSPGIVLFLSTVSERHFKLTAATTSATTASAIDQFSQARAQQGRRTPTRGPFRVRTAALTLRGTTSPVSSGRLRADKAPRQVRPRELFWMRVLTATPCKEEHV